MVVKNKNFDNSEEVTDFLNELKKNGSMGLAMRILGITQNMNGSAFNVFYLDYEDKDKSNLI